MKLFLLSLVALMGLSPFAEARPVGVARAGHRGVAFRGLHRAGIGFGVNRFGLFGGLGIHNRAAFVNTFAVHHRAVRFIGPPVTVGYGGFTGAGYGYAPQAGSFGASYGSGCCGGCCGAAYVPQVQAVAPCQPQIEYSAPAPCAVQAASYAAPACGGLGLGYGGGYGGGLGYGLASPLYGGFSRFNLNLGFHGGHRSVAFRRF